MCVGNLFGGQPSAPPPPPKMAPAPTVKSAAPPAEMITPEKIQEEEGEEKLSTKKKKALEIKKVQEGTKVFSALDPATMPQAPAGGIAPPK